MLFTLASGAFTALALLQQIDTTVTAQPGQRLVVDSYGGEIDVKTWGRNAVRVEADPPSRTSVEVSSSGGVVSVRSEGRRGPPATVDYTITVPAWMGLDLSGVYTDVKVAGVRADYGRDGPGRGGRGRRRRHRLAALGSGLGEAPGRQGPDRRPLVNEEVRVSNASGEITAETVNGDVVLEQVDATSLDATTVNGDLGYDGPIRNGGRYTLSTHNGDITLAATERTNATVMVSTFSGDFESDFPVPLRETRKGRRFSFTLGGGSAQVSLESFQGTIRLVRPGHVNQERNQSDHDRKDHDRDDDSDR